MEGEKMRTREKKRKIDRNDEGGKKNSVILLFHPSFLSQERTGYVARGFE